MSKFARKGKEPKGFEYLKPTLEALEAELRDKVNEPHEGKRKVESLWPVHQINWQRTRYVYDMYYKYGKIDEKVLKYCQRNKIVDEGLMAKWRKPGYEKLCSTYVINTRNYNFGTVSICRVPRNSLGDDAVVECPTTGCMGCASGSGVVNIFGNKYGQSLAKIQVLREERALKADAAKREREEEVVGRDASTGVWADVDDEAAYDDPDAAKKGRTEPPAAGPLG
mmetsp:Transcript_25495/g.76557  ORF Transcript_25495/g.76557 Transcript_25495/m.76557 type:complete len:224 (-) Transcript_25495:41-712(-)